MAQCQTSISGVFTWSMYGLTSTCPTRASASRVLSMVAYVLRQWRTMSTLHVCKPSISRPSKDCCSMEVIPAIRWHTQNLLNRSLMSNSNATWHRKDLICADVYLKDMSFPQQTLWHQTKRLIEWLSNYRPMNFQTDWPVNTYRSDFVQQRHAFALYSVELQLIKLCCNSLQDLTC